MKRFISILCVSTIIFALSACMGDKTSYTCKDCSETTTKAYYDMKSSKDSVMCEDCARKYWMPLDYRTYRVK